jgi:hypothetical protein
MRRAIDRLVYRTVLVCTALAGLAFMHNHLSHPCGVDQLGAGGVCVSTSLGVTR